MKMGEAFRRATEKAPVFVVKSRMEEDFGLRLKGEVFITLRDGKTGDVQDERHLTNVVTCDASVLIARLLKLNVEPPSGINALAIGAGGPGWNLQSPPAATNTQRSLWSDIARKTFAQTQFINSNGLPVAIPTNVVDYTTAFAEAEAVGGLCEMGLMCTRSTNMSVRNPVLPPNGVYDVSVDLTLYDTLVNYLTFPIVNKPATSTLTVVWRLTC